MENIQYSEQKNSNYFLNKRSILLKIWGYIHVGEIWFFDKVENKP